MKVLSVVVPMYNTELYIERCLDSLLYNSEVIDDLEIIVVNDGGTDSSIDIVKEYKKQFPKSIVIINKKNGGHGSAVNAGMKRATGKYIKIVDSDDWVDIDNFVEYINKLKKENADIVVTNVRREQLYDETELDFVFDKEPDKLIPIEKVSQKIDEDNFFFEFSMHSMAVRIDKLREVWDEGLLEKTFYVDQQFVAKVFMCAENYIEYNINIYMYFIGRPEQSMGGNFFNHINDHERVLRWLLKTTDSDELPNYYKIIVAKQIELMLKTHYDAYNKQRRLSKNEINGLKKFDTYLKNEYPIYYKDSGVGRIFRKINMIGGNSKLVKLACHYKEYGK